MVVSEKKDVIIDKEIPIESQIEFLREGIIDRDLFTYKILKERLGEEGDDLYHSIQQNLMQKAIANLGMKVGFEELRQGAEVVDRILGYKMERDYDKPKEFQISLTNCPYLERAGEYGLEKEVCKFICDWQAEQVSKTLCEMKILSKIGEGGEKCTIRFRNIIGNP